MSQQTVYYTFPIAIFQNAFADVRTCCTNAIYYAGYAIARKLQYGTDAEKMEDAGAQLNIEYSDNNLSFTKGKALYEQHYGGPVTSLSKDVLFQYYDNFKNEFQVACLLGFAAFRSILQNKPHCKTNKALVHARMCGYSSVKTMPYELSTTEIKYSNRYHMDKVIRELQHNWYLKTFSHRARGLYFGFEKISLLELARVNEQAKKKTKDTKLRQAKAGALAQARAEQAA